MSINFKNALGTYESALQLRSKRAEVLSGNLVNADTPNFKAQDFNFQAALKSQLEPTSTGVNLRESHAGHMSIAGQGGGINMQYRIPTQPSIDGNTVDEHLEHAEFMRNSLEFQSAFTLLNSRFKGLMGAIKGE